MKKLTFITSVYNGEHEVDGFMNDLYSQSIWEQCKLIVVDAHSTDNTVKAFARYGIEVIQSQFRMSLYSAWNAALARVDTQYVSNANIDDRHSPEFAETLTTFLDTHADITLAYADDYTTADKGAVWGGDYEKCGEPPYIQRTNWPSFAPDRLLRYCFTGCHPVWRSDVWMNVGGFDASYTLAGDYEYWLRLVAKGHKFQKLDQILGIYRVGGLSMKELSQAVIESKRAVATHYQ
jgi:glycosyltransferase involved in cell wall biosynthesis